MSDGSDSREQGIDLGDLDDDLDELEYPTTAEELLDRFGDRDVDLVEGKQRFGVVLAPYVHDTEADDTVTFDSAEEVREGVFNLVGDDAVGREGYSDRGAEGNDEDHMDESL